ncbi:hypothetical protein KKF82_08960 [Patescibacteria group bacterium]|nr:hypothetical protein [Patescibacteria group bacterium]
MGLKQTVDNIDLWGRQVAFRPAAAIAATPTNLFTVVGGAVKITALSVRLVTAITTAVTWHIVACGVLLDTALFAAIGAIGTNVVWPLNVGAALLAPAAVSPVPSILAAAFNVNGVVVTPGAAAGDNFVLTYAAALIDGNTEWSVEYYRLSPVSQIIPA